MSSSSYEFEEQDREFIEIINFKLKKGFPVSRAELYAKEVALQRLCTKTEEIMQLKGYDESGYILDNDEVPDN